jgi:hypothetical protein
MPDPRKAGSWHEVSWKAALNPNRRNFLRLAAASAAAGLVGAGGSKPAQGFAYEPYPRDDELTTMVTSCAHNCGSRHMLVAHKKGNVIVRLSTDDGRYQEGGEFGKDTIRKAASSARIPSRSRSSGPACAAAPTAHGSIPLNACFTRCCALASAAKVSSSASPGTRR